MANQDELNTPMVALVGFLGVVIVFVTIVFLVVVYRQVETGLQYENDLSQPYGEITDLVTRQRNSLASYGWVDQDKGLVSMPISRAMDLVVAEITSTGRADVTRPGETAESPSAETEGAEPAEMPEETADQDSEATAQQATDEPQEVDNAQP